MPREPETVEQKLERRVSDLTEERDKWRSLANHEIDRVKTLEHLLADHRKKVAPILDRCRELDELMRAPTRTTKDMNAAINRVTGAIRAFDNVEDPN